MKLTHTGLPVLLAALALPAAAVPITYTLTATGGGSLGGSAFSEAAMTIAATTDTDLIAVVSNPPGPDLNVTPDLTGTTITISGFGTATFTQATRFFSATGAIGALGFGQAVSAGGNDWVNLFDAAFAGYDMKSAFAPVAVAASPFALAQFSGVGTSLGEVSFTSLSAVTFTAVTSNVPEPATAALLLAGAATLAVAVRRRRGAA